MTSVSAKYGLNAASFEAAVAISARVASVVFNAATVLVLSVTATPSEQGYYFTFLSLIGLAALADTGLTTVLGQFIAHERAGLTYLSPRRIEGPEELLMRIRKLLRISARWYLMMALAVAFALWLGGYAFLSSGADTGVHWRSAWVVAAFAAALDLLTLPLLAALMGLGFVRSAYVMRLVKVAVNGVVLWGGLALGFGLQAVGPGILLSSLVVLVIIAVRFGPVIRSLLRPADGADVRWREEILPMQWRVAISWLAGYFVFAIMTPIAFRISGPSVAGQVGATLGLAQAVMMVAHAIMESQLPRMGVLVAQGDRAQVEAFATKTGLAAIAVSVAASGGGFLILLAARHVGLTFVDRLLPLPITALFLTAAVVSAAVGAIGSYFRAHRREPFMVLSVLTGLIMTPAVCLGCYFAQGYGIALAFFWVTTAFTFPLALFLLFRFQKAAHHFG